MLGRMRPGGCIAIMNRRFKPDGRNLRRVRKQSSELPQNIYQTTLNKSPNQPSIKPSRAGFRQTQRAYCVHDGMDCIREENVLRRHRLARRDTCPNRQSDQWSVMRCVPLRVQLDGGRRVVGKPAAAQLRLRPVFGRFGPVNLRANQRAFDGDPDLPLLLSLENYNDENQTGVKATIFTERTIHHRQPVESAVRQEALLVIKRTRPWTSTTWRTCSTSGGGIPA